MALRNTRNAARLVQSLGDLAQLDEPEFKLRAEQVEVGELLDDIALRFAPRAARQGVSLGADRADGSDPAPVVASVDIELFERAVANLVDNALKFCPAGGRISLAAVGDADGRVRVSVADTGPGIAAGDLPHLFDRFYQSRQSVAPATGEGGKGLGLAIVKRIAELHGGTVDVRSEVGSGTCVTLCLPGVGGSIAGR
jgi:signal transduction histidine kinase